MAEIQLPRFMKWRDGRPRWEIGGRNRVALENAGFRSCDLKDAAGNWLAFEEARKQANRLNDQVDRWRAGGSIEEAGIAAPSIAQGGKLTVAGMIAAWEASETFKRDAQATRDSRTSCLNAIKAALGDVAPGAIARTDALKLYSTMLDFAHWKGERGFDPRVANTKVKFADYLNLPLSIRLGPAGSHQEPKGDCVRNRRLEAMEAAEGQPAGAPMAFNTASVGRQLWTWSQENIAGFAGGNPFLRLRLPMPQGRVRRITDDELQILDQAAIAIGMPDLGDAFILGVESCQRRSDLCAMNWDVRRTGRVQLTQQKTGTVIDFRATARMMERLETIWKRQRAAGVKRMDRILINRYGVAYDNPEELTRYLPRLREAAVEIQRQHSNLITLDDVVLHDSRDTGVIVRFEAGMDTARVSEHSGHSLRQLDTIKRGYLGRNKVLADQATDMLDAARANQVGKG